MNIINVKIKEIEQYRRNNRKHPKEQVDRIAESITKYGFRQPIVLDINNTIIVGHGRYLAAKQLGITEVPCERVEDLTAEEIKQYRILDNKLQNDSTWDFDNLGQELPELEQEGFDLDFWGLRDLLPLEEPEVSDDDFEETEQTETYIKLGDLIELGRHRVLCGDSTSESFDGDVYITDPPYELSPADVLSAASCASHLVLMTSIKQAFGIWTLTQLDFCFDLVWNQHVPSSMLNKKVPYYTHKNILYFNQGESIFDCDNARGQFSEKGYYPSIIDAPKNTQESHGLTKNSNAFRQMLSGFDFKSCIDPFLGSGTTLIACEQLNRTCYGIEIEPKYCQVIIDRYKKYCEDNNKSFECKINGETFNYPEG